MNRAIAVGMSLVAVILSDAVAAGTSFPGARVRVPDPRGRYVAIHRVVYVPAGPKHVLLLENVSRGTSQALLSFERQVDLLWSPDGKALAITDWGGSDYADLFIAFPGNSTRVMKVTQDIAAVVPLLRASHHAYVEALSWQDRDLLRVRAWGYGDSGRFETIVQYFPSRGVARVAAVQPR